MEDVLAEEPVLTPIKNGLRHPDIFEQIKSRAKAKQDVQNVQSFRAQLVKNESTSISVQSKIAKEIRQKALQERKRDKVVEKPIQKHTEMKKDQASPPPVVDLRELINREKQKEKQPEFKNFGPARSEDSFHSYSSEDFTKKEFTTSYACDLVHSLSNEHLSDEQKTCILNKLLKLPIKFNIRMAKGLTCITDERKNDVFSVCSLLLEKYQSGDFLLKYLEFFGNVLKTVMSYDNQNFKKLVEQKIFVSELYHRLINILHEDNIDKVFLNCVAKVVYYSTMKRTVQNLIVGEMGINVKVLVKKLHTKKMKYLSLTCHLLIRHWYHFRHDLPRAKNDAHHDIEHSEWLINALKREPTQEDCLYGLYYIMDKMPMTTVKAVFQTNNLGAILDKSIVAHQLRGATDCELLALKVKLFIHNGNFLSEKQVRDSLPTLPSRANGNTNHRGGYRNGENYRRNTARNSNGAWRRPSNRFLNNDPDLIPLDFEPPKRANYKGVLKSITELKDAEPYAHQDAHYIDRRLEMYTEEENKIVEFTYGRVLHMSKILQKGYCVRYLSDCDHKYIVAGKICELLNGSSRGILLIGVSEASENFEDTRFIEGVHMDRKDRDEFRIGLDNVLNDLITPTPKYQRFEPPVFNPVLEHPEHDSELADDDCEHFVIRLDIKPETLESSEGDVKYKVKNTLLISKKKNKQV